MALILRSSIPRALLVIPSKIKKTNKDLIPYTIPDDSYEDCCSLILASGENKPLLENNLQNDKLVYKTQNINELVAKMDTEYHNRSCCNECGKC